MRLSKLTVQNFRCYSDSFCVEFDDLTALVGQNDVGKSALMDALAVFFGEVKLDRDDGSKHGDPTAVKITCEFDDLPDEIIVDTNFHTSLSSEFMLNSDGKFEICKTYNGSLQTPRETAIEIIAMHPSANRYHDLLTLKRDELKARADELGVDLEGVPTNKNAPIREAIWNHCADLEQSEAAIPIDSEGGRQVYNAIAQSLPSFALFKSDRASTDQDAEAQDPLKAAIKEAIRTVEDKLEEVKEHVETEVRKIAEATKQKLHEMDPSVAETLNPVVTTKKWDSLFQTSITGDEGVPLNKRGSGIKRLVLLNFFRAKAEKEAISQSSSSVIYAIEEPETSQHPKNQRLLLSALRDLSSGDSGQVIITTHTPMLARCLAEENVRFIEKDEDGLRTISTGSEEANVRIAKSLGVLPDHSVKLFIGVEGPNDISFLKGMSRMLLAGGENAPDLDALELDGQIIFFPFGGSNLAIWASRLKGLNRPEYHICDRDYPPPQEPKYSQYMAEVNSRDGCSAIATSKREMENYLHRDAIMEAYDSNGTAIALPAQINDFDDLPTLVARAIQDAAGGTDWDELSDDKKRKKVSAAKKQLNGHTISFMTPARLSACDVTNEVRGWFASIEKMIADADA